MKVKFTIFCGCGAEEREVTKEIFVNKFIPDFPGGIRHEKGEVDLCAICGSQVKVTSVNVKEFAKLLNCYYRRAFKSATKDVYCAVCGRRPSIAGKEPLICLYNIEISAFQLFCSFCALKEVKGKDWAGGFANLFNNEKITINHKGVKRA